MDIAELIKDFDRLKEEYQKLVFGDGKHDWDGIAGVAYEHMHREDINYYNNRMEDVETAFAMLEESIKEIPILLSQQDGDS